MNPFINIGSIPIYLLNEDFPRRAIFFTNSPKRSLKLISLFIKFLKMDMRRVGRELDFVISEFASSDLPLVRIFPRTFKAESNWFFLS